MRDVKPIPAKVLREIAEASPGAHWGEPGDPDRVGTDDLAAYALALRDQIERDKQCLDDLCVSYAREVGYNEETIRECDERIQRNHGWVGYIAQTVDRARALLGEEEDGA